MKNHLIFLASETLVSFEKAAMQYVLLFCVKHGFDVNDCYWVNDRVGTVLSCADHFFQFDDIRFDIDRNLPENTIMDWYESTMELRAKGEFTPNLESYYKLFNQ